MQQRVSYFEVAWNHKQGKGRVRLFFDDRTFEDMTDLEREEMVLVTNLLRLEKPIHYDAAQGLLTTETTPVDDA